MRFRILCVAITIAVSSALTAMLYNPMSVTFFKFREPYFACPIKGDIRSIRIRNDGWGEGGFGSKRRNGRSHSGIDMLATVGAPVYASRSGLAFRGNVPTGYGKYIMIYHPDGTQTFYAHLSNWNIGAVQKVTKGDLIGFVGKTGNAAGKQIQTHLHFEIRKDGLSQDPGEVMK